MSFFIDLKKNIPNWTTESEDTLIRNLKLFSDSYSQKADELSNNIKSLKTELTKIEINYNSNLNLLKNISIKKFIEHSIGNEKVDEHKLDKTKRESTFLTKEQREEVLRRKYKEAFSITLGNLSISDSNKNQATSRKDEYDDNDNSSVSSSRIFDGTGKSKLGIKLPFVIGSEGFYKHDFLGIWNSDAVLKNDTKQTEVVVVEEKVKINESEIKSEKTSLLISKNQNEEVRSNTKASQVVNIDNSSTIVVNNNNKNANIPNVPSIPFPIVKKKTNNDTVSNNKIEIPSPKKENKMDFRAELMMRFNKGNNENDVKVLEVKVMKEEDSKVTKESEERVLISTENKKITPTNINPIIGLQSKRTFFDEEEDEKEADKKGLFTVKDNKDSKDNKDNKENKKVSLFSIPEKEENQQKEVKKKENITNIKSNLLKMFEDDENEEDDEELIKIRSQTIKNKINSILDNKKKDEITIIKTTSLQSTNQRTSIQQDVNIKTQPQPQILISQKEKEEEQKKKRKFFEEDDEKEEKEMKKEEKTIHQSSVFDKEKKAVKRISLQDEVFLKKLNDQSLFPQTAAPKKMSMSNKNVSVQIEEEKVSESIRQVDIQQQKRVINKKKPGKKDMNIFDEVKEKKEENKGKVEFKEESAESKTQPIEVKKQHQDILKEKLMERKKIMFNFDE